MERLFQRMQLRLTRDKADTLLLVAAALLVLLPHAGHLPAWITGLCGVTLLWRTIITVRGTRMPPVLLLLPIALAAMAGIYATFGTILGRDAGVAMLVLLVAFKMLEMHARRDLFVVVYLCLFLVLTNFFYSQSIPTALMMIASVIALLTALHSFQFTGAQPPLARRLRTGAAMVAFAAPAAIVLFLLFPRIPGPLWGMPGDASAGVTGLSDSMSPGNIASLAQSDEPAFSVRFEGAVPARDLLYWRAIVLGRFDGRTWTQVPRSGSRVNVNISGQPVRYQLTLEPGSGRYLPVLELPGQAPRIDGNPVRVTPELEMIASRPVRELVRYDGIAYPDYAFEPDGPLPRGSTWLMVPASGNPRATAWGTQLALLRDPAERINTVLRRFRQDRFQYTLEPPLLGNDPVDGFLFETKAGFCEHFAGSFVFLMRAAGVPARVVTGYQGGEINPVDGYMTVRQADAHAWAEVWLSGRGWVRVDPTAAVAPDRVQLGLSSALPGEPPFGLEGLGPLLDLRDRDSLLSRLRYRMAAINNGWNQWVLNYSPDRQRGILERLASRLANSGTLAAAAALLLLLFAARELYRQRALDPVDALYSSLCRQLAKRGFPRQPHEGPSAYAARLRSAGDHAGNVEAITRFLALYSAYRYGPEARDANLVATLKSLLNESR